MSGPSPVPGLRWKKQSPSVPVGQRSKLMGWNAISFKIQGATAAKYFARSPFVMLVFLKMTRSGWETETPRTSSRSESDFCRPLFLDDSLSFSDFCRLLFLGSSLFVWDFCR